MSNEDDRARAGLQQPIDGLLYLRLTFCILFMIVSILFLLDRGREEYRGRERERGVPMQK